jgi:hypothetical protein
MVKEDLIKRSPLRVLEKSIHGGLGRGNIGVLASPKGVGKTACLVHIATDKLLQDRPVIHVSYASRVDYIIAWYEDIYNEIAKNRKLESARAVHDEIIRNRVIMNFQPDGSRTDQVLRSLEAMITFGKFAAEAVIVDGYDFSRPAAEDLRRFKEFAVKLGLEVWFSASLKETGEPLYDEAGTPAVLRDYRQAIDVLITLHTEGDHIALRVVKDRDYPPPGLLKLKLDPKTLLIM